MTALINTGFTSCEPPHGFEPIGQWFFGSMHHGTGCQRMRRFAASAYVQTLRTDPARFMSALGTVETIRPFHIDQVVSACLFGVETIFKFNLIAGEIFVDKKIFHNWSPLVVYETNIV